MGKKGLKWLMNLPTIHSFSNGVICRSILGQFKILHRNQIELLNAIVNNDTDDQESTDRKGDKKRMNIDAQCKLLMTRNAY